MRAVSVLLALAVALTALSFSQTATQKTPQPEQPKASHGALAIKSDTAGSVFIDGQQRSDIVVGKIAVFNLMPGQHFVELRDATGSILWKDVLSVPKGEQVVRQIHAVQPTSTDTAGVQPVTQPPEKSESPTSIAPAPALDDSPRAVAAAIAGPQRTAVSIVLCIVSVATLGFVQAVLQNLELPIPGDVIKVIAVLLLIGIVWWRIKTSRQYPILWAFFHQVVYGINDEQTVADPFTGANEFEPRQNGHSYALVPLGWNLYQAQVAIARVR